MKDTMPEVAAQIPQKGGWQDGTQFVWLCEPGMKGNFRFVIVLPDGTQHPGEVSCVSETAKNI